MSVVVTVSVPADDFALGAAFHARPTARIELERIVPTDGSHGGIIPSIGVRDDDGIDDPEAIAEALASEECVGNVQVLDAFGDRALLGIEWTSEVDGLVRAIIDHDAVILEASGTSERWRFELRFPDSERASAFQTACLKEGISIDVDRVHDPAKPELDGEELTPAQREVVLVALEGGYFEIPRSVTLVDISEQLGISDQAVSERLRRAQLKLARSLVG